MKRKIGLVVFILIIVLIVIMKLTSGVSAKKKNNSKVEVITEKKKEEKNDISKIKVDIKGNVATPGVYELDSNSRVIDVINLAGGLTDLADTSSINLSKVIKDEDVIIVYTKDKEISTYEEYNESIDLCNKDNNDACVEKEENNEEKKVSGKVNINEASKNDLMTLTGIGESKADKIIEYRDKNGKFNIIEDIINVDGIGDSIFEKIKDNITI